MLRRALLFLSLVSLPTSSLAALPPSYYEDARASADLHVQLELHAVKPPARTPGACTVEGTVTRAFRGLEEKKVALGEVLRFDVSCTRAGDLPPPGGTLWMSLEALVEARVLEAYLHRNKDALSLASGQAMILPAPTSTPALPVTPRRADVVVSVMDVYTEGIDAKRAAIALRRHQARLDRCLKPLRSSEPPSVYRVALTLDVDGKVAKVTLPKPAGPAAVEECFENALRQLRFVVVDGEQGGAVTFKLVVKKADAAP